MKKTLTKISLAAALILTPCVALGSVAGGISESSSSLIEGANVEQQINRINTGISLVRLNTVILKEMPISADIQWVEELTQEMTTDVWRDIRSSDAVKNDPYLSTAMITNAILQRPAIDLTPLTAKMYLQLNTLFKNKENAPKDNPAAHDNFAIPNIYSLPSFEDMDSFITFSKKNFDKDVEKITITATTSNPYENVELAAIALTPTKYQARLKQSREEFLKAIEEVAKLKGIIKLNEAKLKDDKNTNHPDREKWQEQISIEKENLVIAEQNEEQTEEAFSLLIEQAVLEIEANIEDDFETTKVPLAKKLDKVLSLVDDNAIAAGSMFTAATLHLTKNGFGTLSDEIKALTIAQAASNLVGNQKEFLSYRLERMATGALMAIPNIAVGAYYAISQSLEAGKYQTIVEKVLEIAQANEEANSNSNEETTQTTQAE